ncbi:nuclear receptor coactivator 7 [Clupea harengus]|uniref:Nuclear receptor coactivator 7 n=1 Tax=Clupea harengus TaxID=7950 RepID=A0A6P3VQ24_CLUHA|nr:nuclear receptor coactivator 7 [Clupea harengus]
MMDRQQPKDKTRSGYFGNVKNRLGSKLPAGVSQPPGFNPGPWKPASSSTQTQTRPPRQTRDTAAHKDAGAPSHHVPFIRNPRLRQYYLNESACMLEKAGAKTPEGADCKGGDTIQHDDTVFSIDSQCNANILNMTEDSKPLSSTFTPSQLCVPESRPCALSSASQAAQPERNPHRGLELSADPPAASASSCMTPVSPSTDAEYDKLLDVEAVPMPDGELCLLALPPECSQGEGPSSMQYLKLCSRYITNRKGVVSGILLVTSNKIFFDPCKTHPLVIEHGCEEYLLSSTVDSLASVSFCSDISHVHFTDSTQRWKGKRKKSKGEKSSTKPHHGEVQSTVSQPNKEASDLRLALGINREGPEGEEGGGESRDMAEAEQQLSGSPLEGLALQTSGALGAAVLSGAAATFCCGGEEVGSKEVLQKDTPEQQQQQPGLKQKRAGSRPSSENTGKLMFVRFRHQQPLRKRKGISGLEIRKPKTPPPRDLWFTLSQESSDELYAYLSQCRPDLCLLEGGGDEEDEEERDEEDFVLVDNREPQPDEEREEEEEEEEEQGSIANSRAGEDWEMISVEDEGARGPVVVDKEPEGLREIVEQSRILEASHVRELASELPPRTVGYTWHLAYSTSRHGFSLKSLYRKLRGIDSPVLLVIKDSNDQMFGSFLSHPLRPSDKFYGTGETFVYLLHPRFKCFKWTGENSFFIKGDLDSFAIGGGSGHFGLWLDETLYLGRSSPCSTFNNCCLSETGDFRIIELEVWTFC